MGKKNEIENQCEKSHKPKLESLIDLLSNFHR